MIRRRELLAAALAAAAISGCAATGKAVAPPAPLASAPAIAAPPAPEPGPDRSTPPELGPSPALHLPPQSHFTLANGLKVRLVEYRRLPIVALDLVVDAGGSRDPAARPGLASFTAAMLTEGTRTRSATRISDEVGFLGASLSASAGPDAATLAGATLSKHLAAFLEIFADVAMNPAFPKADFERVQDQRLVTLLQQRDQPQALASRTFVPAFWGAHPYGHILLGTEASVKAMRPKDLAGFHAGHWSASGAELVVVGAVTEADLRPLLERTLGRWRATRPVPPLAPKPPAAPLRAILLEKAEAPQAYLFLGMPGLRRDSDDWVASTVAFQVLGGGMTSRLFLNLREDKGYTYGMYAHGDGRRLAGVSFVAGSVRADVTGAALKEVLAEIERMRKEPVPGPELDDAKASLVLGLPADFATAGAIAGRLADLAVQRLPDDYWNRYAELVRKVTAEDVRKVAAERMDLSRLTTVVVANPEVVAPQLAGLPIGPVELRPAPAAPEAVPAKAAAR